MKIHKLVGLSALTVLSFNLLSVSAEQPAECTQGTLCIAAGAQGRTYSKVYAANIKAVLEANKIPAQILTTAGSSENLQLLSNGNASFSIVQGDVFQSAIINGGYNLQHIKILADLGKECIFLVKEKTSKFSSLSELAKKGGTLNIGFAAGGAAKTWEYLVSTHPDFKSIKVTYLDVDDEPTKAIFEVASNQVDAAIFVETPDPSSRMFLAVGARPSLVFEDTEDAVSEGTFPNGKPVYSRSPVVVKKGSVWNTSVDVACTPTLLLTSSDTTAKTAAKVVVKALETSPDLLSKSR